MTPKAAIDLVIRLRDGHAPSAATADRRFQALEFLNHANAFINGFLPWSWSWTESPFTIDAGDRVANLPDDFLEFGQHGGMFDAAQKIRYREISWLEMSRIRMESSGANPPRVFCVRGANIEIPFDTSSVLVLTGFYRMTTPVYTDPEEDTDELLLPERFCRLVLIPGLTRAMQQSKDDARPDWASELRDGLASMAVADNPQRSTVVRWPLSIPGAW